MMELPGLRFKKRSLASVVRLRFSVLYQLLEELTRYRILSISNGDFKDFWRE